MFNYQFGYPTEKRIGEILNKLPASSESYYEEYHGKYRALPVIEVKIGMPVYRIENIRTKNDQKEYLSKRSDKPKDIFTKDRYSVETQEIQHQLLKDQAKKEDLLKYFENIKNQQTEPIIVSDEGVVVNGNRRLCAWRELYYKDSNKYSHFETIRIAVLPDHDEEAMYDLEVRLQIKKDMKAKYAWHAIAADCKEKIDSGNYKIEKMAEKHDKSPTEIRNYIEMYEYACTYLEKLGTPNEWSKLDKSELAFKSFITERKKLDNPGQKEVLSEIIDKLLEIPAEGERLYSSIKDIAKSIVPITEKIINEYDVEINNQVDDDLDFLAGFEANNDSLNYTSAALALRNSDDPKTAINLVKNVLETQKELNNEKEKKEFVVNLIKRASTNLTNAVQATQENNDMLKDGVERQLDNIEGALKYLRAWLEHDN